MTDGTNSKPVPCPRCGEGMRAALAKTAIWVDEDLFVVEDIPAQMCDSCMEQFYDEDTTNALRRLTEDKFPSDEVKREITARVFSLEKRLHKNE